MQQPAAGAREPVGASMVAHLGIMLIASTALFTLVGLLGPIIRGLTGYSGPGIAVLQVIAGLSSLAGIRLGARYAMGQNRSLLAVLFLVLAVSLAVVVPSLGLQQAGSIGLGTIFVSVVLGPVAQFSIGATVQARLAALAGSSATFVFALNASMVYLGQGLGIALGAVALDLSGIASAPAIGAAIALTGCLFAVWLGHFTKNNFQTARG
jgi:predicted MFS family arabinose efflux permease